MANKEYIIIKSVLFEGVRYYLTNDDCIGEFGRLEIDNKLYNWHRINKQIITIDDFDDPNIKNKVVHFTK